MALEACVQARNEGRDLAREGNEIIRAACKWSPELAAACEVWKAIKFEFEQSVAFKHDHSKSFYIVFFGFGHGCGGGRERHKARAYCGYCLFGFHIFVRMC